MDSGGKGVGNTAGDGPAIDQSDAFARATAADGVKHLVDGQIMEVRTSPGRRAAPRPERPERGGRQGHLGACPLPDPQAHVHQRAGMDAAAAHGAEAVLRPGPLRRVRRRCLLGPPLRRCGSRPEGRRPPRAPAEAWASGPNLWLIDAVASFGGRKEMLATLKNEVFGERTVKSLQATPGGSGVGVVEW